MVLLREPSPDQIMSIYEGIIHVEFKHVCHCKHSNFKCIFRKILLPDLLNLLLLTIIVKPLKPIISLLWFIRVPTSCCWVILQLVFWVHPRSCMSRPSEAFCFLNWPPCFQTDQLPLWCAALLLRNLLDSFFIQIFALINNVAANKLTKHSHSRNKVTF